MKSSAGNPADESAVIIVCPQAEPAVREHRDRHDRAARAGVPAHVTVVYPFKPVEELTEPDHAALERVIGRFPGFTLHGGATGWFGDEVLYVAPSDPDPIAKLTEAVVTAFPDYPPYGGVHEDVVPHLTIGDRHPPATLAAAERAVWSHLPFVQVVDHLELWAGPAMSSGTPGWRRVRDYDLQRPAH